MSTLTRQIHAQLIASGKMKADDDRWPATPRPPRTTLRTSPAHAHLLPRGDTIAFGHGLGDAVHFAHSLPLYLRRGHRVRVACPPPRWPIFQAAGAEIVDAGEPSILTHDYTYPPNYPADGIATEWQAWNKPWHTISHTPMKDIGRHPSLWQEYCSIRLDLAPFVPADVRTATTSFLASLPRPLIVVHPQGTPPFERRSLAPDVADRLYQRLLAETPGTIILLDWAGRQDNISWDGEVPLVDHPRVLSMRRDWHPIDLLELYVLLIQADLFIGVDSGPLHFLRFTDTLGIGLWTRQQPPFGSPIYGALPRARTCNVIPHTVRKLPPGTAELFNIVHSPGGEKLDGDYIAELAITLINGDRKHHASKTTS